MGNARHHPFHQANVGAVVQWPKAQSVQQRNRSGTHRENIAQNSANPSRRTLKWLHRRRVVVAFDFESKAMTVTKINNACVLPRTHQDARPLGGETAEQWA
jgi:hypothetical protein